jgi:membrane-associated protein
VIFALGLDAESIIDAVGLLGVWAIVFAESGLLVGFFLPGDALLFTAGFLASGPDSLLDKGLPHFNLFLLILGVVIAAIAGDQVGYVIGRRVGPALFKRPDSRFFKQQHVDKAASYFEKYGPRTIVLARFVPVVRTFAPVVAGVSKMEYRTFVRWNVIGGVAWGVGVTTLGYFLGQIDFIEKNIEATIVLVVLVSCLPVVLEVVKARKEGKLNPVTEAITTTVIDDD